MTRHSSDSLPQSPIPNQFDVLVIGTGAAGLYAALCLPENLQIGLITKDQLQTGASAWAQGGIAAAIAPNDSPQFHLEDTLQAGVQLCDHQAVQFLVEHAAQSIDNLVKMGVAFDRRGLDLAMTLEAAHSRPRVLHAADTTGHAIITTLTQQVLSRSNIQVVPHALVLSLWKNPETGECQGVSLLFKNKILWVRSSAVILATGGGGQVFAQTTNPEVSTGDGVAIAWRSGAILRNLEFVQFHPTALTKAGAPRFLISEAVRGEGAYLVDDKGDRFVFAYHPDGELAPRDVVSRGIFNHLQKNSFDPTRAHVYLDLRPIEPAQIRHRFPNIIQVCQQWDVDVFTEPIPVSPAAHYWMGGVATNLKNCTSIPGLYVIGEAASTGVHGANRLASNSLLECLVYAQQLANLQVQPKVHPWKSFHFTSQLPDCPQQTEKVIWVREQLPQLMWKNAGICRSQRELEKAITQVQKWRQEFATFPLTQSLLNLPPAHSLEFQFPEADRKLRTCAETLNLLDIAYLILKSAAFRTESRGGHYRVDYPETVMSWRVHTLVQGESWWKGRVKN